MRSGRERGNNQRPECQSQLAYGFPTTNPWYAILTLPVLVLAILLGAWSIYRPLTVIHAAAVCVVWSVAGYRSMIETMIPHQTRGADFSAGLKQIASHHAFLHFTGPVVLGLDYGLLATLFCVVLFHAWKTSQSRGSLAISPYS